MTRKYAEMRTDAPLAPPWKVIRSQVPLPFRGCQYHTPPVMDRLTSWLPVPGRALKSIKSEVKVPATIVFPNAESGMDGDWVLSVED